MDYRNATGEALAKLEAAELRNVLLGIAVLPELPTYRTMSASDLLGHVIAAARKASGMEPKHG